MNYVLRIFSVSDKNAEHAVAEAVACVSGAWFPTGIKGSFKVPGGAKVGQLIELPEGIKVTSEQDGEYSRLVVSF